MNPEYLVDPVNNDKFVYWLTVDGFTLYSKGKNKIDEYNQYNDSQDTLNNESDDHSIWPTKH